MTCVFIHFDSIHIHNMLSKILRSYHLRSQMKYISSINNTQYGFYSPQKNPPRPNDVVKHYKGDFYRICDIAKHTETEDELVIYRLYHKKDETPIQTSNYEQSQLWARPLTMFCESVEYDGSVVPRFTKIGTA